MSVQNPVCTVVVSARDRFSPTEGCLDNLLAVTPEPVDLILVLGGAPEPFRAKLQSKYASRVRFIFEDRFLNCAEARNLGLRAAKTKLAACLDNDVYPRAGWLAPLLRCQEETGAGLVVPLMLENERNIHTAGSRLFITHKGGKPFAAKVLPFYKHEVHEGTNLKREPSDYGEMHCQLVDAKAALELGVLDERVQEGEELDSGLSWKKGGRSIWFEPESIVVYDFPLRLRDPMDIPIFKWRWNIRNLIPGYRVMHAKWGMDMTEVGDFKYFLMRVNGLLGVLPRVWPTRTALAVDDALGRLARLTAVPGRAWSHLRAWSVGYYDWVEALEDPRPPSARIAAEIRGAFFPGGGPV
ncbi:MAG: glycosyltransferase [Elusimicrobia bacterium]|nr:glycosyltransferase [Elusimicrobiota bacterium]